MVFRSRTRHRGRSRPERSLRPQPECLEVRLAPAGSGVSGRLHPAADPGGVWNQSGRCSERRQGNGSGQTIAIVCAYSDSALVDTTNSNFAPATWLSSTRNSISPILPSFEILNEYGTDIGGSNAIPRPATDPTGAWEDTEALDVEWAHAIAPDAAIVLIECNSDSAADMFTGVTTAEDLPGVSVVSMNQSSGPAPSLSLVDDAFTTPPGHQGVTFVAPAGDSGSPGWLPAYSSNVVAVGGTSLTLNPVDLAAPYQSEQAWSDTGGGGGTSEYGTEPAYQDGRSEHRLSGPFPTCRSTPIRPPECRSTTRTTTARLRPGYKSGGTSLSAACWAGLIAIADQGRVAAGGTTLDGPSQTLPALYSLPTGDFHDITSGGNGTFNAGPGYDLVTGLGTPEANVLVSDLASYELGSQLVVSAQPPSSVTAGTPFGFTVTALDSVGGRRDLVQRQRDGRVWEQPRRRPAQRHTDRHGHQRRGGIQRLVDQHRRHRVLARGDRRGDDRRDDDVYQRDARPGRGTRRDDPAPRRRRHQQRLRCWLSLPRTFTGTWSPPLAAT